MDLSNYNNIREDSEKYFSSVKPILCPALKEWVTFSSESFNHIIYKSGRTERDRSSQIMRFKLLPKANELIALTTTYQEYEETLKTFEVKRRKKRVQESKTVIYWGLIAIIDNRKIKVILRKIGNGKLHFWSVIPAWVTNKTRDYKFSTTMKGNPEED